MTLPPAKPAEIITKSANTDNNPMATLDTRCAARYEIREVQSKISCNQFITYLIHKAL